MIKVNICINTELRVNHQGGHQLQLRLDHRELRAEDGELQERGVSYLRHLQGRGRGGGDRLEARVLSKRETENW